MSTQNDNPIASGASSAAKAAGGAVSNANVQATISAIRTIAKTKELEQKVERLLQNQRTQALPGLNAERLIAQQAVSSAGSTASSSVVARDEDKDPGDITDDASKEAADAAAEAAAALAASGALTGGAIVGAKDKGSTDKSGSNNIFDPVASGNAAAQAATDAAKGQYRASDLFGNKGPNPSEPGDPNSPKIQSIIGEIAAATAWLVLRDKTPQDGVPTGWNDADHPPVLPGWEDWEQGYWGQASGTYGGTAYGHSVSDAVNNYVAQSLEFVHPSFGYHVTASRNLTNHGTYWTVDFYVDWSMTGSPINSGWIDGYTIAINKLDCGLGNENEEDNCPLEPPTMTSFPEDGYVQLYWNGTKWTYQHYDSEAAAIVRTTLSTLVMTDGGKSYTIGPTVQGGWYATFTDQQPGTTPAMLIRPDGTVRDVIDRNLLKFYAAMDKEA